ncbi:hypothetical protein GJAV_G00056560 [Gymnothorax javanicus]|nr:hypothetical protein GJAV_G00056560 [Gymnothorax javanicus]
MLRELQGIVLCQDGLQLRRRRGPGLLRTRSLPLEERRPRVSAAGAGLGLGLSNGKLCGSLGVPAPPTETLSQRLAQEAALVMRSCGHARICPECRRFQGLRVRPAMGGASAPGSPAHSEDGVDWDKASNSSEPE